MAQLADGGQREAATAQPAATPAPAAAALPTTQAILDLQRTYGNAAVSRMLIAREESTPEPADPKPSARKTELNRKKKARKKAKKKPELEADKAEEPPQEPPEPPKRPLILDERLAALPQKVRLVAEKDPATMEWFAGFTDGYTEEDLPKLATLARSTMVTWNGEKSQAKPAAEPVPEAATAPEPEPELQTESEPEPEADPEPEVDTFKQIVDEFVSQNLARGKAEQILAEARSHHLLDQLGEMLSMALSEQLEPSEHRWRAYLGFPARIDKVHPNKGSLLGKPLHLSIYGDGVLKAKMPSLETTGVPELVSRILNLGGDAHGRPHSTLEYINKYSPQNPHWYLGDPEPKKRGYPGSIADLNPMKTPLDDLVTDVTQKVQKAKDEKGNPEKVPGL